MDEEIRREASCLGGAAGFFALLGFFAFGGITVHFGGINLFLAE
jgi:hypothetical protein